MKALDLVTSLNSIGYTMHNVILYCYLFIVIFYHIRYNLILYHAFYVLTSAHNAKITHFTKRHGYQACVVFAE